MWQLQELVLEVSETTPELLDMDRGGPPASCPGCGGDFTTWVEAGAERNLLCLGCGCCWRPGPGSPTRVAMRDCAGCDYQAVCLASSS